MNREWIRDGQMNARGGVSSAFSAEDLPANTLAWSTNVSIRGGKPHTRPVFVEQCRLPSGRVQGVAYFSASGGMFIAQVSGVLYRIFLRGAKWRVEEVPTVFYNAPSIPTVWMQETDHSFIVQDGQSSAIIYDGATARRSKRSKFEVPIGKQMAYGNGRLWVATPIGLVAGDIKQSSQFQSELLFTETNFLLGGGAQATPRTPTALAFMPITDTSTGMGPLLVFSDSDAETIRADVSSRDLWGTLPGFHATALPEIGAASHHAVVRVNQDLYFRSSDGAIRSFRSARAEIAMPGNTPISREVSRITDFESAGLLSACSAIYFDDRLLMTASPFLVRRGHVGFRSIVSLDVSPLSSNQGKLPPAYDGEWNGASFSHLVKGSFYGEKRGFAITTDALGVNRLWEIKKGKLDAPSAGYSPVKSSSEYRKFAFNNPDQLKQLMLCRVYLSEMKTDVTLEVQYRSDNEAQWTTWDTKTFSVTMAEVENGTPHALKNIHPHYRSAVGTFTMPDEFSPITDRPRAIGYLHQIRLVWTGCVQIDRIEVFAKPITEPASSERSEPDPGTLVTSHGNEIHYAIDEANSASIGRYVNHAGAEYHDQSDNPYTDK